jgi:hypothetical protein
MKARNMAVVWAAACMIPSVGFAGDGGDGPGGAYTATSSLRVSWEAPYIMFPSAHRDSEKEYETYKKTQEQLLKSRFVLLAALRKAEVAKLPDVQVVQNVGDVVRWLENLVKVGFPGDAEIMTVSVTTGDPHESATLARAVVDAYLTEVVNAERDRKRQRLSELDRAYVEKETDVRAKREDLKKLAEMLGVSDSETLTLKQRLALGELYEHRKELRQLQAELRAFKRDLAVQKAALQDALEREQTPIGKEIKRLETLVTVTTEQELEIKMVVERCWKEAEKFGMSTVDIEMMRAEIKNSNAVLTEIATERERLRIEIRATPRVTLLQRADVPESKD